MCCVATMRAALVLMLACAPFITAQSCSAIKVPAPCGQQSDGEERCLSKGCCYDTAAAYPCFYPGGDAVPVTDVHVVQASHFDAGFAYTIKDVLQLWWYTHYPRVLRLGLEIDAMTPVPAYGMKFTTQCWLVDLFFNCPPNVPGLTCPTAAQQANLTLAIQKGYLTWHAFPANSDSELHTAWLLTAGIGRCHALDERFGLVPKATISQRDVPGMTRAILPVLAAAGVRALSVGANGASTPPFVPRAFVWRDAASGVSLPALIHPYGYGGLGTEDAVRVPGLGHVLVFEWEGDNAGPPQAVSDIARDWAGLAAAFPGARIFSSTFDNFTAQLTPAVLERLPVIEAELGDTWIHGPASDPMRVAYMKRASRLAAACTAAGACVSTDPVFANFTRLLLKCGEHTWGKDIKTFLHDTSHWSNVDLRAQLAAGAPNFLDVLASWQEQRAWCIDYSLGALQAGGHALAPAVAAALADLTPTAPPQPAQQGYAPFAAGSVYAAGRWSIGFDAATGAIATLADSQTGQSWASPADGSRLAWLHYVTLSADDYVTMTGGVASGGYYPLPGDSPDWYKLDFGKPNLTSVAPLHQEVAASLGGLFLRETPTVASFLVQASFADPSLHAVYGAPAAVWLRVDVPRGTGAAAAAPINITLELFDKTATRLPEGLFLRFNASRSYGANAAPLAWSAATLSGAVDPFNTVQGGNHHLHGVSEGIVATKADPAGKGKAAALVIDADSAAVASFGRPWPLPNPVWANSSNPIEGAGFLLCDNTWGTVSSRACSGDRVRAARFPATRRPPLSPSPVQQNFPMWYPFVASDANMRFRFSLTAA